MTPDLVMTWRKSRASGGEGGNCVEVRSDLRAVRDSKHEDGPPLAVDVSTLVGFLSDIVRE